MSCWFSAPGLSAAASPGSALLALGMTKARNLAGSRDQVTKEGADKWQRSLTGRYPLTA